jgi:hypothetical protein
MNKLFPKVDKQILMKISIYPGKKKKGINNEE